MMCESIQKRMRCETLASQWSLLDSITKMGLIDEVFRFTSENVFVPLTVGGGIRDFTDANDRHYSSLEVALEYFRSGADKISIGSDAVYAAEAYIKIGVKTGKSSLEQISRVYGNQEAELAKEKTNGYKLDRAHKFAVSMFDDFDRFMKVPDEWAPPETMPYTPGLMGQLMIPSLFVYSILQCLAHSCLLGSCA